MEKTAPPLSPRLKTIADLIGKCDCFADIGTDHAYLPVWLCKTDKARSAIACDINPDPLLRAKKTVDAYDANRYVELRLGGGLEPLKKNEADAVAIAGMGGLLIADIINSGIDKIKNTSKIILQPMSAISELREYLYLNGWRILSERLSVEEEKIYNIFCVAPPIFSESGEVLSTYLPTRTEVFIGKSLIEDKPEHFDIYLKRRRDKLDKMIIGLKKSSSRLSEKKLAECIELKGEINKIII